MNRNTIRLNILRLLLEEGEDVSLREVARRLKISSSLTHYHMQKMTAMGILVHGVTGKQEGYYAPQRIFDEDVQGTNMLLRAMSERIEGCDEEKLGNCISFFLKLSKTV